MAMSFNFVRRDNLYVSEISLPEESPVNFRLLKKGCVYAGSYVLSLVHPDKVTDVTNVNIFYPRTITFSEYEHIHLQCYTMNFWHMDIVLGATVTRRKKLGKRLFIYNISTSVSKYNLIYHLEDYVDLDKSSFRIYYNELLKCVEIAVPVDELCDPYSTHCHWNYNLKMDEDIARERYEKYNNMQFIISPYDETMANSCVICKEMTHEKTLHTRCCNNVYHQSCMNKWNDCDPGKELQENRCRCPMCRALNTQAKYPLIVCVDFSKWKLIKCYDCSTIFPLNRHVPHSMYCYECVL